MNTPDTQNPKPGDTLKKLLDRNAGGLFSLRSILPAIALIVIVVAGWWFYRSGEDKTTPRYETEAATVGMLVVKVSATGNLQPTNTVDVGS